MVSAVNTLPSDADASVEEEIAVCLNPDAPCSFFLYAGAGSGKTYSLIKALENFRDVHGPRFRRNGQKIVVITYTNAACDEIIDRIDQDPLFAISTIHSFCWAQISSFHEDIRRYLLTKLPADIAQLEEEEARGRAGTKASVTRQRSIADKRERLDWLSKPRLFTYNPNGDNVGRAALSHSEVLQITAVLIQEKPTMRRVLANQYPFLLIDESQDTNKLLVEAFFQLADDRSDEFGLGLIGDTMQRIYGDGKPDLGVQLPEGWAAPAKRLNRRCPKRVIALANDIRATTDQQSQAALEGADEGFVRLFIAPSDLDDKQGFERAAREKMQNLTGDEGWGDTQSVKTLTLEHRMSALRMGFDGLFEPLYADSRTTTGLLDGSLPALRFFSGPIQSLLALAAQNNQYGLMALLRSEKSPLLEAESLTAADTIEDPLSCIREAVAELLALVSGNPQTSFLAVLQCVVRHALFKIPDSLRPFSEPVEAEEEEPADLEVEAAVGETVVEENTGSSLDAISAFLETPYSQIEPYTEYVSDNGAFDTHQGVKGREFERVMVVMDDSEARGFLFSYEKLFEVKDLSASDQRKQAAGEETGPDRTKRLLYVTCTRAEKSLALVAYTENPAALENSMLQREWFHAEEIIKHPL